MRVQDIMSQSYPALYMDELATKARAILRETGVRLIPVIDEEKRLVGIVTRSDLMMITSSVSPISVRGIMSQPRFTATLDMDVMFALKRMLYLDQWCVPVVKSSQNSTYEGVFALENFIEAALKRNFSGLSKRISEIMSTDLTTCSPNDEVDNVWRLMQEKSFAGLPVVKKGKLVGIITQKDLLESGAAFPAFEAKRGRFKAPPKVSSVMRTTIISLKPSDTIKRAAELMIDKNIGRIPIIDGGKLVGIVDREDIVRALLYGG